MMCLLIHTDFHHVLVFSALPYVVTSPSDETLHTVSLSIVV